MQRLVGVPWAFDMHALKIFTCMPSRAGFISLADGSRQFSICTGNFLIKLNVRGWLLLLRKALEEE